MAGTHALLLACNPQPKFDLAILLYVSAILSQATSNLQSLPCLDQTDMCAHLTAFMPFDSITVQSGPAAFPFFSPSVDMSVADSVADYTP